MFKSLVTGGAGFMGSHVVDELISMGHEVVVLDDLSGGFIDNINPAAHFVAGSIVDHQMVDMLFDAHRFDYVYHLAGTPLKVSATSSSVSTIRTISSEASISSTRQSIPRPFDALCSRHPSRCTAGINCR